MLRAYTTTAIRSAEARAVAQAATDELMRQAARAVADVCINAIANAGQTPAGSVSLAFIGGGDNGGDGLYASAMLAEAGLEACAVILTEHCHERALETAKSAGVQLFQPDMALPPGKLAAGIVKLARRAGVWIDAIVGTGCVTALRRPIRDVVRALEYERESSPEEPIVVAVDVPSGIGDDDGAVAGPHLRATHTVTMGERKASSLIAPAMRSYGTVHVVDLNIEYPGDPAVCMLQAADVGDRLLVPNADDHKYTRGVVQVVAGSDTYPMTGVLNAGAALRCGVGMVRYAGPSEATLALVSRYPEVVLGMGRYQSLVVGSGIDLTDKARVAAAIAAIRDAAAQYVPTVIDASLLLKVVELQPYIGAHTILTPHAGEAAQLLTALGSGSRRGGITRSEVEAEPSRCCIELSERTGATVVLKGGQTLVFGATGIIFASNEAPAWAATAGSGDVLAGTIAAVAAGARAASEQQGNTLGVADIVETAAVGVWLHGRASRIASGSEGAFDDPAIMFAEHNSRHGDRRLAHVNRPVGRPIIASDIVSSLPLAFEQAIAKVL